MNCGKRSNGAKRRLYLLEKWDRQCAYCSAKNVPLEIEHIQARSKGGSNRVSNLTLACTECNIDKGNKDIKDFLKRKPKRLKKIQAQAKASLKDTAAVNATRYATGNVLKSFGLPIEAKVFAPQKLLPRSLSQVVGEPNLTVSS